jgi:hypothetical protein
MAGAPVTAVSLSAIPKRIHRDYNVVMSKLFYRSSAQSQFRRLLSLSALVFVFLPSLFAHAQDTEKRGRKYQPPPSTAHISVAVIKDANGKPIENAAVVFHLFGEEGKGNMEMKTNEEGKAIIDVVPIGDSIRLQVVADGFQTYGEDYKIDTDSKEITVRLKRPGKQYSTYANSASGAATASQAGTAKQSSTTTPPKQ